MIYVLGRFGYVGSNLIPYLERRGHDVVGIGRHDPFPTFRPDDCVINCACAGWRPWEEPDVCAMEDSNAALPLHVASVLNGANMIHLGASVEWQKPLMPYSRTKALAAKYLKRFGKAHICYLYTAWGGKNVNTHRFMDLFVRACREKRPFCLTEPYGTRDWVHINRICAGIESLIDNRDYREHHFGAGVTRRFVDVVNEAENILGHKLFNVTVEEGKDGGTLWKGADPPFFKDTFIEDLRAELCE